MDGTLIAWSRENHLASHEFFYGVSQIDLQKTGHSAKDWTMTYLYMIWLAPSLVHSFKWLVQHHIPKLFMTLNNHRGSTSHQLTNEPWTTHQPSIDSPVAISSTSNPSSLQVSRAVGRAAQPADFDYWGKRWRAGSNPKSRASNCRFLSARASGSSRNEGHTPEE